MRGRRLTQSKKLSHLAIATDAHSSARIVWRSRAAQRAAVLIIVLLAIAVGVFLFNRGSDTPNNPEQKGSDVATLVDQASGALVAENTTELETLVGKIAETKDYDTNQDALYILVTYYIKTSNATKAREYLDKLMLMYDGSKGFSKKLGSTKTILQLEADVIFLEKQASQFEDGLSAGVGAE